MVTSLQKDLRTDLRSPRGSRATFEGHRCGPGPPGPDLWGRGCRHDSLIGASFHNPLVTLEFSVQNCQSADVSVAGVGDDYANEFQESVVETLCTISSSS